MGVSETAPVMVPLAEPRPLSTAERALLDALVDRTGHDDLRAQAGSAVVWSACSCGCPSAGLRVTGPQLSTVDMVRLSRHGRDDYFGVHGYAGDVEIVVHVLQGTIDELEVYAGDGLRPALPSPAELTDVAIY
jgi:hypothetical protein